jgi:hypothetical protein
MDLIKTLRELRREKEKLERVIASLEELHATGSVREWRRAKEKLERLITSLQGLHASWSIPARGRRGRRSMSIEERRELSTKIKRYWEERHNQRRPWC